jgi:hypothetical protein
MLYSSSRDNMKRTLGVGYFVKDYYCNDVVDLKWSVYQQASNDKEGGPLSEMEQLKKEEAKMERDTATHSSAMAQLGFEVLGCFFLFFFVFVHI